MASKAPLFGDRASRLFRGSESESGSSLDRQQSPSPDGGGRPSLARKANPFGSSSGSDRSRWAMGLKAGSTREASPEPVLGRMGAQRDTRGPAGRESESSGGPGMGMGQKRRSKDVLRWMFGQREDDERTPEIKTQLEPQASVGGYEDEETVVPQLKTFASDISLQPLGETRPRTPNMRPFRTKADEAPGVGFLEEYAVQRMRDQVEADLRVQTLTVDEINLANGSTATPRAKGSEREVAALTAQVQDLKATNARLQKQLEELKNLQELLKSTHALQNSPSGRRRSSAHSVEMEPIAELGSPRASPDDSEDEAMPRANGGRRGSGPLATLLPPSAFTPPVKSSSGISHSDSASTLDSQGPGAGHEPPPHQLHALQLGSTWRSLAPLHPSATLSTDDSDTGGPLSPALRPGFEAMSIATFPKSRRPPSPTPGDHPGRPHSARVADDVAHSSFKSGTSEQAIVHDIMELGRIMASSPAVADEGRQTSFRRSISQRKGVAQLRHTLAGDERSPRKSLLHAAKVGTVKQTWRRRGMSGTTASTAMPSKRGSARLSQRESMGGSTIPELKESKDSESGSGWSSPRDPSQTKLNAVVGGASSGEMRRVAAAGLRSSTMVRGSLFGEAKFSTDEAAERVRDLSTQVTDTVQVGDRSGLFSTYAWLGATQDVAGLCGLLQAQRASAALVDAAPSFSFALEATVLESFSPEVEYGGFLDEMVRFCVPLQTVNFTVGPCLPRTSPSSASCRHDKVHNLFFTNANGSSTHGLCHTTYSVMEGKINNTGDDNVDDVAEGDGTGILRTMYRAALTIKAFVMHKRGRYVAALRHRALRRVAWLQVSVETCHCILGEKPLHGFYSAVLEIIAMGDHNHILGFEDDAAEEDPDADLHGLSPRALVARRRSFFDSPSINKRRERVADERRSLIERLHTFDINQEASKPAGSAKEHFEVIALEERAERVHLLRDLDTGDATKIDGDERHVVAVADKGFIGDRVGISLQIPCITPSEWSCIPLLSLLPPVIVTKSLRLLLLERSLTVVCPCAVKVSCIVMALHALMSPLKWCGTVIPLLPLELIEVLHSPSPLLAGVCFTRERIEREEHDNLNLLVVGDTADDARFVSERATCDWSDAGLLSDDALEQAVSDAQMTLAQGPRRGSMFHLVRLMPQVSSSAASTKLSPLGLPEESSFSNNLTRLMRGLTTRERRATRQLRNGVVEHHRRLCGDLARNIRNWKKYGLYNREDDEFFFQADLVHNEMKKEFAFRTTVTNTQAFAEFVEFCRVRVDDEDRESEARDEAAMHERSADARTRRSSSVTSMSSSADGLYPVGIRI